VGVAVSLLVSAVLGVPTCTSAALQARLGLQGATGSLAGGVELRNRGRAACLLAARPRARFVGSAARVERLVVGHMRPLLGLHETASIVLRPGRAAWLTLWWSNWCGPGSKPASGPAPPPDALVLEFPGRARVRVATPDAPRCDVPSSPSRLDVGGYSPRP
jgi:hypothetical protein